MHHKSALLQTVSHVLKDLLTDLMFLNKMAEFQQSCGIRYLFIEEIKLHELAHGIAVISVFP